MADARDTLVLLTASYPFGSGEPFIDSELPILARRFARVIILPSERTDRWRQLPPGVRCETFLAEIGRASILGTLLRHPAAALLQYGRAILQEASAKTYLFHPIVFIGIIGLNLRKYRLLREFVRSEGLEQAVFYDYWLENSTLALSQLRRKGVIRRAVARAHRFDLYDEWSQVGAVPFRVYNVASLDRVFAISVHGLSYLEEKHPDAREKLRLSRLGVESHEPGLSQTRETEPLIVSCAWMRSVKRIHAIPDVLARIGRPVRWVHFGDGPERADVERAASAVTDVVSWQLVGHVDREDIIEYYRNHEVDLFISLSASEGLPVSMMEAISFGIPVLATSVGGVPEIVTGSTGRLVDVADPPDVIAAAIRQLLDGEGPTPHETVAFFEANFQAAKNYGEFVEELDAL